MCPKYLCEFIWKCLLFGVLFIFLSVNSFCCIAMAGQKEISPYDPRNFEALSMPGTIPNLIVDDQRSSEDVFVNLKRRMESPADYFRDGLVKSIPSSTVIMQSTKCSIVFAIKNFIIEREKVLPKFHGDRGQITCRIKVDVYQFEDNKQSLIDTYHRTAFDDIDNISNNIKSYDFQNLLDRNFHGLLVEIFSDEKFITSLKQCQ